MSVMSGVQEDRIMINIILYVLLLSFTGRHRKTRFLTRSRSLYCSVHEMESNLKAYEVSTG